MKTRPSISLIFIIVSLFILIILSILYVWVPPPPDIQLKTPKAEVTIEKDIDNDYIVTIKSIDFKVPSNEVTFHIFTNIGTSVPNVESNISDIYKKYLIVNIEPKDNRRNITYYDNDIDENLSKGDYFVLETDWDGLNNDGNGDGNFSNDGPIGIGQIFQLLYPRSGWAITRVVFE